MLGMGTRKPGLPNSSAAPISATRSSLVSAIVCPNSATPVVYPVILPCRSTTLCRSLRDRVAHFTVPVVAMHLHTHCIARPSIRIGCWSNGAARHLEPQWFPLHHRERFTNVEPELRVQAHRTLIRRLQQPHPWCALLGASFEHRIHQLQTDSTVLHLGIDGDGADAANHRAFVEEVAADDPTVVLRDDSEEPRMSDQSGYHPDRDIDRREVGREAMVVGDGGEGVVTDTLHSAPSWRCLSNLYVHDAHPLLRRRS